MICPRSFDDLTSAEWTEVHDMLKRALAQEIADAAPFGDLLKGPTWWVDVSHKKCIFCGCRTLRCRIKGHPLSPFYACFECGYIMEWRALSEEAVPDKPQ